MSFVLLVQLTERNLVPCLCLCAGRKVSGAQAAEKRQAEVKGIQRIVEM